MNQQPYGTPPHWWPPRMTPWWVRLSRGYRLRQLRTQQQITSVIAENADYLRDAVAQGAGVLITPNHSVHYDSAALYVAADQIDCPIFFMTAWQVFAMSSAFECWAMQRLGCFSVDREGSDRQAFKQAVSILRESPHPLVIFPEGDIYHTSDLVTPFREGAAAIALSAAKRSDRPVVAMPCGIRFWYQSDPTESLLSTIGEIEDRLYLRASKNLEIVDRIHRIAEAALALKELDYLGHTRSGRVRDRVVHLQEAILSRLEATHQIAPKGGLTDRAKAVRQCLIAIIETQEPGQGGEYEQACREMGDVFFAMQLYSYPGDYLLDHPSIERISETVDKFEEDILERDLPSVRGRRQAVVKFGEPIPVESKSQGRGRSLELTERLRQSCQELVDELAARSVGG